MQVVVKKRIENQNEGDQLVEGWRGKEGWVVGC